MSKLIDEKKLSLKASFENIKNFDDSFLQVKMKVFAFGDNRNGSSITKEAFEIAKPTIFNKPIVAKYTEDEDIYGSDGDLEGHNPYLTTDKDGNLTIKNDTYPIGVIGSDANVSFEEVNEGSEKSPDIKTYVVVDNVFLWKRYEATQKIQEWMSKGIEPKVSMEINNIKGGYSKDAGCYKINSFTFEAVAALGSTVTPCFPMAQLEQYSTSSFEDSFFEMLKQLNFSLKNMQHLESNVAEDLKEGGFRKVPEDILSLLQKYSLTEADLIIKEIVYSEFSIEDLEAKIQEMFEKDNDINNKEDFSLTSEQLENELYRKLCEIETLTEVYWDEVYTYPRYSYIDNKTVENIVIAWDCKECYMVGAPFTMVGDAVEINTSSIVRYKSDFVPMAMDMNEDIDSMYSALDGISKSKSDFMINAKEKQLTKKFEEDKQRTIAELNINIENLQAKYSDLELKFQATDGELAKKTQIEREKAEAELFESFSTSLTEEEISIVKEDSANFSLQEIEDKLCVILGRKTRKVPTQNFSKTEEAEKPIRYSIVDNSQTKTVSDKSYADIIIKKEVD